MSNPHRARRPFTASRFVRLGRGGRGPQHPYDGAWSSTILLAIGAILPAVRDHLATFVGPADGDLVFTTATGRPIWRGNFNKLVAWPEMVASIGLEGLHFHDLRHAGNMMAARTATSLRDLMARMGHDSPAAALIYQHATREADQAIAAG